MSDRVFVPGPRSRSFPGDDASSRGSLSVRRLREIEALLGVSFPPPSDPEAEEQGEGVFACQAVDLLRAFHRITDPEARRAVLRLVTEAARGERA